MPCGHAPDVPFVTKGTSGAWPHGIAHSRPITGWRTVSELGAVVLDPFAGERNMAAPGVTVKQGRTNFTNLRKEIRSSTSGKAFAVKIA
jgi:hypothetical protein